jgi:hypothetical protein
MIKTPLWAYIGLQCTLDSPSPVSLSFRFVRADDQVVSVFYILHAELISLCAHVSFRDVLVTLLQQMKQGFLEFVKRKCRGKLFQTLIDTTENEDIYIGFFKQISVNSRAYWTPESWLQLSPRDCRNPRESWLIQKPRAM